MIYLLDILPLTCRETSAWKILALSIISSMVETKTGEFVVTSLFLFPLNSKLNVKLIFLKYICRFYLITVEIEAKGAAAVMPMMLAIDAIMRYNEEPRFQSNGNLFIIMLWYESNHHLTSCLIS